MELRAAVTCVLILMVVIQVIRANKLDEAEDHCAFMEISNSWWHRSLEGVYEMKNPTKYYCNNRTVYRQDGGNNYLYFVVQGVWSGWMIGLQECLNKGYISVGDQAFYPDEINSTWEEYNSMKWIFNKDIISGCHIHGVTRPPRIPMKTKTPTTTVTITTEELTTTHETPYEEPSGSSLYLVIYVVIPLGCVVILALVTILCTLAMTHGSFLKRYEKYQRDVEKSKLEKKAADVRSHINDGVRVTSHVSRGLTVIDHCGPSDKDSVYEILSEPVDAMNHVCEVHRESDTDNITDAEDKL